MDPEGSTGVRRHSSGPLETGRDPRALKADAKEHLEQKQGPTFSELVEDFLANRATKNRATHREGLSQQVVQPDDA